MINELKIKNSNLIIFIFFLIHLLFINWYPVNFEHSFAEASKFTIKYDISVLNNFFNHQANTIGFSIIAGLLKKILFFLNELQTTKFLSALGSLLICLSIVNLYSVIKPKVSLYFILYNIIFNPILWIFSFRGTPDLFATSIGLYSFTLLIKYQKYSLAILSGILSAVSIITKPLLGIYIILIFLLLFRNYKIKLSYINNVKFIIYLLCSTFIVSIFFLINNKYFNFLIIPPNEQIKDALAFNISNFINNLIVYFAYCYLFSFPLIGWYNFKLYSSLLIKNKILILITLIIFFILGYLLINPGQEMNLGPLSPIINFKFFNGILGIFAFNLLFVYYNIFTRSNNNLIVKYLIIILILYCIILSFFLPSQRYLIVILPIIIFLLSIHNINLKFLFLSYIFYIILISILMLNQFNTGNASNELVQKLIDKKMINDTCPGAIEAHNGHLFTSLSKNCGILKKKFQVISGYRENESIMIVKKGLIKGMIKTYSVIEIQW